jgi:hypothetical protein
VAVVTVSNCASGDPLVSTIPSQRVGASEPVQPNLASRCSPFVESFDELAACERANGTLETFAKVSIAWRVRYFVRYWRMPCNEAPTEQEGYVFHMVTNDLNGDENPSDSERLDIRAAMFDGLVRCR